MIDTPIYVVDDPEKNRSERGAKARLSSISASALNATVRTSSVHRLLRYIALNYYTILLIIHD